MQASVRQFCPLHKTINIGNGTECLLRCCSAARILHSERPAFAGNLLTVDRRETAG